MNKFINSGTMLLALLYPLLSLADDTLFSPAAKNMTGEWDGVRTELRNRGYDFTLEYSSMTATNISGGYDRDKTLRYSDQYILGINMDLEKIVGIRDGEFKVSVNNRNGRDLTQDRLQDPRAPVIGSGVQSNYGRGQTLHATQFWFKKSWWDKKFDLKVGLMPQGEDFDNNGCFFQNLSLCGSLAGHGSGVWYNTPIGQWGTRIKYSPDPSLYVQVGAFQYNPDFATRHGSFRLDGRGIRGTCTFLNWDTYPLSVRKNALASGKSADGITQLTLTMSWMTTMAIPISLRNRPPGDTEVATEVISMSASR